MFKVQTIVFPLTIPKRFQYVSSSVYIAWRIHSLGIIPFLVIYEKVKLHCHFYSLAKYVTVCAYKTVCKEGCIGIFTKNEKLFALRFTQVIVIQWAPLIHTYFVCIQTNILLPKIHLQWCLIRMRTFSWEWYCGNIQCVLELTSDVNMRRKHLHIGLKTRCCCRRLHVDIWLKYKCDKRTTLTVVLSVNIVYKGDLYHLQKQYEYLHRCLVFSLMSFSNIVTDLTVSTIVTCATDNFYTNIHKVNTHHYTVNYP